MKNLVEMYQKRTVGATFVRTESLLSRAILKKVFRDFLYGIIIIIIIKTEKIRVTLCENAAGALYIVNKMCVDGQRNVQG